MPKRQRWQNIEIRPDTPPAVTFNELDRTYWIEWEDAGLAVSATEDELRTLMAEAMIAQAQASVASDAA